MAINIYSNVPDTWSSISPNKRIHHRKSYFFFFLFESISQQTIIHLCSSIRYYIQNGTIKKNIIQSTMILVYSQLTAVDISSETFALSITWPMFLISTFQWRNIIISSIRFGSHIFWFTFCLWFTLISFVRDECGSLLSIHSIGHHCHGWPKCVPLIKFHDP